MVEGHATAAMYLYAMSNKQDKMLDKQDATIGKLDTMLDKQDQMLGKQDQMLGKQDQTTNAVKSLQSNMGEIMNARFQKIEDEIAMIKARLPA